MPSTPQSTHPGLCWHPCPMDSCQEGPSSNIQGWNSPPRTSGEGWGSPKVYQVARLRPPHLPSRRHTKPLLSAGTVNCFGRKASKFGEDGFPSCGPHFRTHSCLPSWWMRSGISSWLLKPTVHHLVLVFIQLLFRAQFCPGWKPDPFLWARSQPEPVAL